MTLRVLLENVTWRALARRVDSRVSFVLAGTDGHGNVEVPFFRMSVPHFEGNVCRTWEYGEVRPPTTVSSQVQMEVITLWRHPSYASCNKLYSHSFS